MTKTQYYTATSLDGFIADAANSLNWLNQFDEVDGSDYGEFIEAVGALAMGSTTYEWMLANHIRPGTPEEQPWPYTQPTWIFSSRDLPAIDGADIRFVRGDVRTIHVDMVQAAAGKNVWIVGGGDLAGQFWDHGLLDELIITVAPVTLGGGAPLLPRVIATPPLRLISAAPWRGGTFVRLHYAVQKPAG